MYDNIYNFFDPEEKMDNSSDGNINIGRDILNNIQFFKNENGIKYIDSSNKIRKVNFNKFPSFSKTLIKSFFNRFKERLPLHFGGSEFDLQIPLILNYIFKTFKDEKFLYSEIAEFVVFFIDRIKENNYQEKTLIVIYDLIKGMSQNLGENQGCERKKIKPWTSNFQKNIIFSLKFIKNGIWKNYSNLYGIILDDFLLNYKDKIEDFTNLEYFFYQLVFFNQKEIIKYFYNHGIKIKSSDNLLFVFFEKILNNREDIENNLIILEILTNSGHDISDSNFILNKKGEKVTILHKAIKNKLDKKYIDKIKELWKKNNKNGESDLIKIYNEIKKDVPKEYLSIIGDTGEIKIKGEKYINKIKEKYKINE